MSQLPEITLENQTELEELALTLDAFQGQFLLIFARCNYDRVRSRLIQCLQDSSPLNIRTIMLNPDDTALYQRIQGELQGDKPGALMVLGLESVLSLERMLAGADLVREEFRQHCPFPVVVWVTDSVKAQWMQFARNLESWGVSSRFTISRGELAAFVQEKADQWLIEGLVLTETEWLEFKAELEAATGELQVGNNGLEPELAAALFTLLGICQEQQGDISAAIDYFEQALVGWRELQRFEYEGIVLREMVYGYFCQINRLQPATIPRDDYNQIQAKIKESLQQALTAFNRVQRPDLIADSIGVFGQVLRELKDWQQLQELAEQALAFDQGENRRNKLALDYTFLADVALAEERWQAAKELAETALSGAVETATTQTKPAWPSASFANAGSKALNLLLVRAGGLGLSSREFHSPRLINGIEVELISRCYWIKARSHVNLGQCSAAIEQLEFAHGMSQPLSNPRLYLDILAELHHLYWQTKDYLKAFKIKQERQTVETQLGLRAFIGASRVPSIVGAVGSVVGAGAVGAHRRAPSSPPQSSASSSLPIAPEIIASGWEKDVQELVERVQLQAERIRTLADYQQFGTKEELVLRYLAEVVEDCGEENQQIAELLLYLLTNEKERRLLKTRGELEAELKDFVTVAASQLDLILEILELSGLVFVVPDTPDDRYQLVHDYLVSFIRQQQEPKIQEIIAQLNQEREQRQQLERSIERVRGELRLVQGERERVMVEVREAKKYLAQAQKEREEALKGTELERLGTLALRQFNYAQIPALLTAMRAGRELKAIVKDRPLDQYPAYSPLSALQQILDQIRERNQLRGHESVVLSVTFSPDGEKIASASYDKTVRLWDKKGAELAVLRGHESSGYSVTFSPDGEQIASASDDKTVRLWRVETLDDLLVRGCDWLRDYLHTHPDVSDIDEFCAGELGVAE